MTSDRVLLFTHIHQSHNLEICTLHITSTINTVKHHKIIHTHLATGALFYLLVNHHYKPRTRVAVHPTLQIRVHVVRQQLRSRVQLVRRKELQEITNLGRRRKSKDLFLLIEFRIISWSCHQFRSWESQYRYLFMSWGLRWCLTMRIFMQWHSQRRIRGRNRD